MIVGCGVFSHSVVLVSVVVLSCEFWGGGQLFSLISSRDDVDD